MKDESSWDAEIGIIKNRSIPDKPENNMQRDEEETEEDDVEYTGMPKSLRGRFSTRSVLMNSLRSLLLAMKQANRPGYPVFFTSAGQIRCEFVHSDSEDNEDELYNIMFRTNLDMIRSMEANENKDLQVVGSASYILVKNAVLQPWNHPKQKFQYDRMCLFVDDILGFTIHS